MFKPPHYIVRVQTRENILVNAQIFLVKLYFWKVRRSFELRYFEIKIDSDNKTIQAGAELCQAQADLG